MRLRPDELAPLLAAARERGTTPANWLRSLALARLLGRPTPTPDEVAALRAVFGEMRRVARLLEAAGHVSGPRPTAEEARAAAEAVRAGVRQVGEALARSATHWITPFPATPAVSPGCAPEPPPTSPRRGGAGR